jgi:hypothetical protein
LNSSQGTFRASTVNFSAFNVTTDDFLAITGSQAGASSFIEGVYKIAAIVDQSTLTISTGTDQLFPSTAASSADLTFRIMRPGMDLQQKASTITQNDQAGAGSQVTSLSFVSATNVITRASGSWLTDGVQAGDVIAIQGTVLNNSSFLIASVGTTGSLHIEDSYQILEEGPIASVAGIDLEVVTRYFLREIPTGGSSFPYRWRTFGNNGSAQDVFQWIQFRLRQTSDIDEGNRLSRGDITDLLMTFATPTGTTLNMFIDDLDLDDINNVTFRDATGIGRLFPFVSTITLQFNNNLTNDDRAKFWVFFTNDDAGDNSGRDYGTKDALIVQDSLSTPVQGSVNNATIFQFDYDYTNNQQRGSGSEDTDAPITVIAIGLSTAQFVITTGTITEAKGIVVSLVSSLERNYSNPS